MKPKYMIFKNLRNLLPYLVLIGIYFFFINIEAKKQKDSQKFIDGENNLSNKKTKLYEEQLKISIPVIPYKD